MKRNTKDEHCDCMCHREGAIVRHIISCCDLCYQKFLTPDSVLIESAYKFLLEGLEEKKTNIEATKDSKKRIFKVGLDVHGIASNDPEFFSALSKLIIDAGWELHVISGRSLKKGLEEELEQYKISYTHIFSIVDYHEKQGTSIRYDENGGPWIDNEAWNRTKGDYCEREQIDFHLDDSDIYGKYFSTSFAQAIIKKRK